MHLTIQLCTTTAVKQVHYEKGRVSQFKLQEKIVRIDVHVFHSNESLFT